MARPNKFELTYFPLDIAFFDDHKCLTIEETEGIQGVFIALRLMAMVYADQGYYLNWEENFEKSAAKRIGNGITGQRVLEILELCFNVKLFHRGLFNSCGILTSHGIQKRWLMVQKDMNRKIKINDLFWLVSSEDTGVTSQETHIIRKETADLQQSSTQKEKKGKEIKGNSIGTAAPVDETNSISPDPENPESDVKKKNTRPRKIFVAPDLNEVKEYFLDTYGNPKKGQGYLPEDVCSNLALKMFAHYSTNGWVQGRGKPIVSWKSACTTFMINYKEGIFEKPSPAYNGKVGESGGKSSTPVIKTPPLSKLQVEINYMFDVYREDKEKQTVKTIDVEHYNILKTAGYVQFNEAERDVITEKARKYIEQNAIISTDSETALLTKYQKKFGVLAYFDIALKEQKQSIFSI